MSTSVDSRPDDAGKPGFAPDCSGAVAGGIAVVLICTALVALSRRLLPGIYAFGLSLLAWMVVLSFVGLALTLYAGSVCCRTPWHRAVFTLVVLAALALEGALLLPGETGLGSRGSWVAVCGGSGLMILIGVFTLARFARQRSGPTLKRDPDTVTPAGDGEMPSQTPSRPALSVTTVIGVVAGLLLLAFLGFWLWVYVTPHQ